MEEDAGRRSTSSRRSDIDALRGVAILMVIVVHSGLTGGLYGTWSWKFFFLGQRGVQLFYALSAYTIFMSLDRPGAFERGETLIFYLKRFFRIAPMFYLAVMLHAVAARIWPEYDPLTLRQALMAMTFTFGIGPHAINAVAAGGWSVAVETTFYVITPLLFLWLRSFWSATIALCIAAPVLYLGCGTLGDHFTDSRRHEFVTFLWFPIQFPVFLMGIVTYWSAKVIDRLATSAAERRRLSILFLAVSVALLGLAIPTSNAALYTSSLAFPPLILAVRLVPWRLIVNAVIVWIGTISYSLYLLHFYAVDLAHAAIIKIQDRTGLPLDRHIAGAVVIGVLTVIIAAPICWATQRWIEKPFIDLGHRLARRLRKRLGEGNGPRDDQIRSEVVEAA